jgi:sensor histidine kinase YesM
MDFQKNEKLFSSGVFRYLVRIVILYIFSTIFKSFDLTFTHDIGLLNLRGQVFSLFYVIYGLLAWEGATLLARAMEKKVADRQSPARIVALGVSLLLYGLLVSFLFSFVYASTDIWLFHRYEAWESASAFSYDLNFGTFMFYLLLLTFNGIIYYYKGWKEYQLQTERLMRENIQAKYDALRNQIDPHFFFNSLSVLTNLVYKNPDVAADYITQLAKTYRYILDKKFENLVPIQVEMDFLESYLFLIRIRHRDSIRFVAHMDEKVRLKGMIPPATLQLLVENAIKHNRFSANDPLLITLSSEENSLTVSNRVNTRVLPESASSGIGLENIRKRYELTMGKGIHVARTSDSFIVKVPVIYTL